MIRFGKDLLGLLKRKSNPVMFEITKRLEQANQASSPREHREDEQQKAGRDAENSFVSTLRSKTGLDSSSVFCGLRVPDEYRSRRREIDVVLLAGHGIFCIEIKNWGGRVTLNDDGLTWLQTKKRKLSRNAFSSEHIEHNNGVTEVKKKADLLRDHLSRNQVFVSESLIHCRVVFVNANVELDEKIANDPAVVKPEECEAFIASFQRSYLASLQDAVVPSLFTRQLSYSQMNQARSVLKSIGTWDILELHGGKRLYGDFKECQGVSLDRQKTETLEFSHQRNRALGLVWAVIGYYPMVTVSLLERGGTGWLWNSYVATVKIPYNTDLVFRICGDEVDSKVPVNDVDRIVISI